VRQTSYYMSEITDKRNNNSSWIDIILSILESGHSVELPATGYSMFPTFLPGDEVVVRPLTNTEYPKPGSVVVCMDKRTREEGAGHRAQGAEHRAQGAGHRAQGAEHRAQGAGLRAQGAGNNSVLVMHRLIDIKYDGSGNPLFITRGDSGREDDRPWPRQQLMGVAVSYKRGKRAHLVKNFVPGTRRYKYNRSKLWMISKINRITTILDFRGWRKAER
jgi:hypothetical protein